MQPFTKTVRPGRILIGHREADVFVQIIFDGKRLSITGVEGPLPSGNARGCCGQIVDTLDDIQPADVAPGWTVEGARELATLWRLWHLNDMRAGTPAQEAHIREHRATIRAAPGDFYRAACAHLDAAGLLVDDGHRYGAKWLHEDIPPAVVAVLRAMPGTDKDPAWV